jgi:hypothetical protein
MRNLRQNCARSLGLSCLLGAVCVGQADVVMIDLSAYANARIQDYQPSAAHYPVTVHPSARVSEIFSIFRELALALGARTRVCLGHAQHGGAF